MLQDFSMDEEDESEAPKTKSGAWKPQVHFVWNVLLDDLLPKSDATTTTDGSFPEFFRILVDGTCGCLLGTCCSLKLIRPT